MPAVARTRADPGRLANPAVISDGQWNIHVLTETLAVVGLAPLLIKLALQDEPLTKGQKGFLMFFAIGTIVVDGGLLVAMFIKSQQDRR